MPSIDDKIESLQTKLKQAKALKAKQEAQKRAQASKAARADDTRRKILIGAAVLSKVEKGEWSESQLCDLLQSFLTKEKDLLLFPGMMVKQIADRAFEQLSSR